MKNTPQSFGLLKTLPIYDPDIILKLPFLIVPRIV